MGPERGSAARSARLVLLALVVGAAVMVLEIAAPRLMAPHVGTGALAWTTVIGTFLLGIALGNLLGGRLADRVSKGLLPALLLLAAGLTFLLPLQHAAVTALTASLGLGARTLLSVPLVFLPVAVLLGAVPPVLARSLLTLGHAPGARLGAVAAAGAAGSVGGTLLAGFSLLPAFGLGAVVLGTGGALALSTVLAPWRGESATAPDRTTYPAPPRMWLGLAMLQGFSVLALEILAGRLASDRLGASLYAWTSVIGVVLLGLTLGAVIGGRLADRIHPKKLLRALFLAASAACLLLLWAPALLDLADGWAASGSLTWPRAILAACALTFLLPSIIVGTLSPVVIRAALAEPATDGRVVGRLYAAGTLGAMGAAIGLGYVLIPLAGLERLTLLLAFALASTGGALSGRRPYALIGVILLLWLGVQGPFAWARRTARALHLTDRAVTAVTEDSRYARIRVFDVEERWVPCAEPVDSILLALAAELRLQGIYDPDEGRLYWRGPMSVPQRETMLEIVTTTEGHHAVEELFELSQHRHRRLHLDRLVHGYVDLDDPLWLGYGYERLYATALEHLWPKKPEGEAVRCFFVGGGAYAFQGRLLALHGEALRIVTAEIDPMVTAVARDTLRLRKDPRHEIVHEDARTFVETLPIEKGRFDLVFGDAFNDIAVPFHLTTAEFVTALKERMAPDGAYVVNVVDTWKSGRFLGAFLSTLEAQFENVTVLSMAPRVDDVRYTYVVVATDAPLTFPSGEIAGVDGRPVAVASPEEIADLCARAGHRILTDDHAPVETLLAPVLRAHRPQER